MLLELMSTGHMAHGWEWPVFVACTLVLVAGSAFLGVAWRLGAFKRSPVD